MTKTNGHKAPAPSVLDDGDEIERIMRRFYPLIIESSYLDAADDLGMPGWYDAGDEEIARVIDGLAKQVRNVAETTKEEIRDLIRKQAIDGWNPARLAREIVSHGITASKSRSRMIARTETIRAFSQGSITAWKQSGVVTHTRWLATDADTCDICQALDGVSVAIGTPFPGGHDGPPAHPNCRCAISPVVARDED